MIAGWTFPFRPMATSHPKKNTATGTAATPQARRIGTTAAPEQMVIAIAQATSMTGRGSCDSQIQGTANHGAYR